MFICCMGLIVYAVSFYFLGVWFLYLSIAGFVIYVFYAARKLSYLEFYEPGIKRKYFFKDLDVFYPYEAVISVTFVKTHRGPNECLLSLVGEKKSVFLFPTDRLSKVIAELATKHNFEIIKFPKEKW